MRVRLLADDRTGAIDTAVRLVPLTGPLPVRWMHRQAIGENDSFAFDLGTREADDAHSARIAAAAAPLLRGADLAYLKCDSLLRGSTAAEIAACLQAVPFDRCIIAPAFPAQRRIMRDGRQWAAAQGVEDWHMVGHDLELQLHEQGFPVSLRRPGDPAPPGVSLWDAETENDLLQIAAAGHRAGGQILWCGTAGLAEALAGRAPIHMETTKASFLGLIGTDHPVTQGQLRHAAPWHTMFDPAQPASRARIESRLAGNEAVVVTMQLPATAERHLAHRLIETALADLLAGLPQPGTLFVTGGETLSSVCTALGTEALEVHGEIEAGIPVSLLRGGRWDGATVISKSGAFGNETLIERLISSARS